MRKDLFLSRSRTRLGFSRLRWCSRSYTILKDWNGFLWFVLWKVFEILDCMNTYMLKVSKLILGDEKMKVFIKWYKFYFSHRNVICGPYALIGKLILLVIFTNYKDQFIEVFFDFTMYFYNNEKYDFWSHAKPFDFKLGLWNEVCEAVSCTK